MSQQLIKQLREQRMAWVVVDDACTPQKRVRIIRPTEVELSQSFIKDGEVSVGYDQVKAFVKDWDGFTEATLLGAGVGASDPLPFAADLWAEVVSDHADWVRIIARALLDAAVQHSQKIDDSLKN
jgi:hypothetical protein